MLQSLCIASLFLGQVVQADYKLPTAIDLRRTLVLDHIDLPAKGDVRFLCDWGNAKGRARIRVFNPDGTLYNDRFDLSNRNSDGNIDETVTVPAGSQPKIVTAVCEVTAEDAALPEITFAVIRGSGLRDFRLRGEREAVFAPSEPLAETFDNKYCQVVDNPTIIAKSKTLEIHYQVEDEPAKVAISVLKPEKDVLVPFWKAPADKLNRTKGQWTYRWDLKGDNNRKVKAGENYQAKWYIVSGETDVVYLGEFVLFK